ncbi:MAG: CsgG/HfaB family protein [Steroidobacteraceae bacterium]
MKIKPLLMMTLSLSLAWAAAPRPAAAADAKAPTSVLDKLAPKPLNQRAAVSIYEFRSQVSQVTETSATDMFMTALVRSHQFRVVERNRLNEGVAQEKRLNAAGQTTGDTAQKSLRGAQYLFEGAVTEANAAVDADQGGINIGGLQLGGGKSKDVISVDVRILDADTGDVLDSITVSKAVKGSSLGISGTAALVNTIAESRGGSASAYTPDVSAQTSKQDGLDAAVRACIEDAVLELAKRVELTSAQ